MSNRLRAKLVYAVGDALEKRLDELCELASFNNAVPPVKHRRNSPQCPIYFVTPRLRRQSGIGRFPSKATISAIRSAPRAHRFAGEAGIIWINHRVDAASPGVKDSGTGQ
jgi:acyl-CoA reductase-like NAD-dependent aldehyde dehydrogenase